MPEYQVVTRIALSFAAFSVPKVTGLVAAIVFHAYNGIRVMLVDFWSKGTRYHRVMLWVVMGLFVVTMAGFLPRHLMHVFGGE